MEALILFLGEPGQPGFGMPGEKGFHGSPGIQGSSGNNRCELIYNLYWWRMKQDENSINLCCLVC